jgi:DDE family transposase
LTVHPLRTLLAQRVFALALGYEDLNDHDQLRDDPAMGVLLGKLDRNEDEPSPLAGKSALNRLGQAPGAGKRPRCRKISHDGAAIETPFGGWSIFRS